MSGLEALSFMVYKCRGSRSRHLCLHLPLSPQPCWSWHYWGGEHHQHSTRCLESNHSSQAEQSPYSAEGIIHSLNKYNNIPVPTNLHSRGRRQTTKVPRKWFQVSRYFLGLVILASQNYWEKFQNFLLSWLFFSGTEMIYLLISFVIKIIRPWLHRAQCFFDTS